MFSQNEDILHGGGEYDHLNFRVSIISSAIKVFEIKVTRI